MPMDPSRAEAGAAIPTMRMAAAMADMTLRSTVSPVIAGN